MTTLPLTEADVTCGAKAECLGALLRAGFAVPDGFVTTAPASDELDRALAELGPGPFAVRSSAIGEDGATASYAGQLRTTLQVPAEAVADAVRLTATSGNRAAPRAYAERAGVPGPGVVPVIVQRMVRADSAGVLFTRDPLTGAHHTVIEAARGSEVVDGRVNPERWIVDGDIETLQQTGQGDLLAAGQPAALAAIGRRIEALFGSPQDVEWAIEGGEIWILQARPITTTPTEPVTTTSTGRLLLTGTPASPGAATAQAHAVRGLDDFARFREGGVLVCTTTSPAWTPLLAHAAAVVTETGGMLAHAAIVAREFGIPAVVGAAGALELLDGRVVLVDGDRGTVREA